MAKIIVEQVQGGSGGTALTVPTAAATVNNQAVVGSTAGVLSHSPIALPAAASGANNRPLVGATSGATSFSPLALPAADGTANKPITTDGSGQLQFGAVGMSAADGAANKPLTTNGSGQLQFGATALPAADGTANQVLQTNGSGVGSWGTISSAPVLDDHDLLIGALYSHSNRENVYSTGEWSTSGPNSTYYHELQAAADQHQAWNMALGDGKPQASQNGDSSYMTYAGNTVPNARYIQYAHNRRLGYNYRYIHYGTENGTSYPGCSWMIMPIRNSGSSSVTCSFKTTCSSRGNYAGTGQMVYTATYSSGTNYANATGGSWTVLNSYDSATDSYDYTASVVVPANQTVLYMVTSSWNYRTSYRFFDTLLLRELQTAFTHADIKCDLRMLETLYRSRSPAAIYNAATPYEMYTSCATLYGDR